MFNLIQNPFILQNIIEEIRFLFEFQWVEKGLQFKIIWDEILAEESIVSDSKRIKQVLINLLSNSIKFTEAGTICVKINKFKRNNTSFLKFIVKDTGVGINQIEIPMLFK